MSLQFGHSDVEFTVFPNFKDDDDDDDDDDEDDDDLVRSEVENDEDEFSIFVDREASKFRTTGLRRRSRDSTTKNPEIKKKVSTAKREEKNICPATSFIKPSGGKIAAGFIRPIEQLSAIV